MKRVDQRFYTVQRIKDGLYLQAGKGRWTEDVSVAHIVSKQRFKGIVRADLGMDMEQVAMVELVPALPQQERD